MQAAYTIPAPPAELFSRAREAFDGMIHHLESSAALTMNHTELEAYVVAEGREVQRRLLQAHLDLRSAAERPVRAVGADGIARTERRRNYRGLMSLVGELQVHRLVYQAVVTTGLGGSHYQRDHRYPGTHPLVRRRFFALPAAARGRAWSRRSPTAALRSARFSPVRAASRSGVRVAEAFLEDEVL